MRLHALHRSPLNWGWMAKRPIPHEVTDRWFRPLIRQRQIRRDLTTYLRASRKDDMIVAAEGLRSPEDQPAELARLLRDFIREPLVPA